MQYYFYIDQNPNSPTYEKPRNVARLDKQATPIVEQSWTDKGWQDNPDLLSSISGIGGDGSQWQETTEAEAKKFIEAQSGGKPVLVFARPADKSLQAYKNWIQGMVKRINPNAKNDMTDADWERDWKAFWSGSANKP
jgi:hypothetical protein